MNISTYIDIPSMRNVVKVVIDNLHLISYDVFRISNSNNVYTKNVEEQIEKTINYIFLSNNISNVAIDRLYCLKDFSKYNETIVIDYNYIYSIKGYLFISIAYFQNNVVELVLIDIFNGTKIMFKRTGKVIFNQISNKVTSIKQMLDPDENYYSYLIAKVYQKIYKVKFSSAPTNTLHKLIIKQIDNYYNKYLLPRLSNN